MYQARDVKEEDKKELKAAINNHFRSETTKDLVLTSGVSNLNNIDGLIEAVRSFDAFNEDNDPYGEHDFGSLEWEGEKVFWKIDYYAQDLSGWCDPLSVACRRVLTVMLAEEY